MYDADELVALDADELANDACVVVDWRHADWTRTHFQTLQLGKDYLGDGEVPYVQPD